MVKRTSFNKEKGSSNKGKGGIANKNGNRNGGKLISKEKGANFPNKKTNNGSRGDKTFNKGNRGGDKKFNHSRGNKSNFKKEDKFASTSNKEEMPVEVNNNNFFDFDGDTSIINKLRNTGSAIRSNSSNGWNYKNVIQNEQEVRKMRDQQTNEETRHTSKEGGKANSNEQMEIEEGIASNGNNNKAEVKEEDNYNSNNVNKFESELYAKDMSFCDFNLAKIILKGLASMEYFHPTKVQEKVIPLILRGHDVLVNAETGSGKTACFLLPIIQKIITNKRTKTPIRALIILPTRELAYQCSEMLSSFTKYLEEVTSVSICGGMSIDNQINQLRATPDVIVATPGRLIDMLYNYKSVNSFFLDNINILVLDEADKLLELGFNDAIMEIINLIKENTNRQTLLFSATLSPKIIDLGKDTLKNPVKVKMSRSAILTNLKQSIVRMRFKKDAKEEEENDFEKRMSYLINLLLNDNLNKNVDRLRSIIFFNTKKECHKACLALKKFSILCSELHSDIPQPDRLKSLDEFQKGVIKYLVCTDIAARGIDIEKVRCVINFQMPLLEDRYIHRIGRTARKGYMGEAITICDEKERLALKKLLKKEAFTISNIVVDNQTVKNAYKILLGNKAEVAQMFEDDMIEKELLLAEKDVEKTINMKQHSNEIYNKPRKSWFMNRREKKDLRMKINEDIKQKQI